MSSREPLWFCHECGAETIPLMAPDPICASCNSSFVEKLDDPDDDPRAMGPVDDDLDMNDAYMTLLSRLLSDIPVQRRERNREHDTTLPRPAYSFSFTSNNTTGTGTRSFTIGNRPEQAGEGQGNVPTLGEYIRRGPERDPQQPGAAGIQAVDYFMSMLGLGPGGSAGDFNEMFARGFGSPGGGNGTMGDYALNQQALDDIITQIMESTNSHRPVAASKEIIDKLPREVLEEKSPLLEKDCAVCKDQFSLTTEDPDEQIIVTLPCHHAFHQPCILPWLETSGTCPVCRHQLIPQPEEHHGPAPADRMPNERANATGQPTPAATGGLLRALFGGSMVSPASAAGNSRLSPPASSPPGRQSSTGYFSSDSSMSNNRRPSRNDRRLSTDNNNNNNNSRSDRSGSSRDNNQSHHVPGGWDDLD
ncbi:hypothetical protein CYLTODRAFT_416962 [Cylindrobasidium torrendii FP15055 ss-10]|uniref:RING-type domain-containing protein n=1 Tax=Cylindrobasidium torrendii FP15055 ss-10 TaxID=1314674 RepID=A0A0D7BTU0_9AGAR|nr:hypothetical protein CYLTODRAFT_416962 [Cylindrobasidium torrendii FP15055 ss-10]